MAGMPGMRMLIVAGTLWIGQFAMLNVPEKVKQCRSPILGILGRFKDVGYCQRVCGFRNRFMFMMTKSCIRD